jgi:hypothetical protein
VNRIAVGIRPAAAQVGKAHTELVGLAITKRHVPDADGFPCYGRGSVTIQVAGEVVSNTKGLAVPSSEIRRHPEVSLAQAVQLDRCDTHRVLAEEMLAEVAKLEFTLDSRKGCPGPHTDPSNIDAIGIPDTIPIGRGGWLYATFAANTTYSSLLPPEPIIRLYAARIPPLNVERERTLFASVLFPVPAPPLSFDENILEAQTWDDAFAKIVHCAQPRTGDLLDNSTDPTAPVQDAGIQLGWDDEQLVIWFNRQADSDPLVERTPTLSGVNTCSSPK